MVVDQALPSGGVSRRHLGFYPVLLSAGLLLISAVSALVPKHYAPQVNPNADPLAIRIYQPEAAMEQGKKASILLVGDIMLGRGVADEYPFEKVANVLSSADLAIGNFEGVIADQDLDQAGFMDQNAPWYRILAPEKAASQLQVAGFDLVSLANNHSLDFGAAGLAETAERLRRSGIRTVGAGASQEKAYQPALFRINGVRVAVFGINAIGSPNDAGGVVGKAQRGWEVAVWSPWLAQAAIRDWRSQADVLIVLIHWGDEYEVRASPTQKEAASLMVEAGADLVVGAHPHVVQDTQVFETQTWGNRFVAYSLGNFVFDQYEEHTREGLALRISVDSSGVRSVEAIPVLSGPKPSWMDSAGRSKMIERIRPEPHWIGFRCQVESCWEAPATATIRRGLFKSGQLDLNGDHKPEVIRLIDKIVTIFEGEKLVWKSPPEWQVIDVALGDPNHDGRGEALLALLKPDGNGELLSHPFLVGHRGGIYRLIWGGSAVPEPIQELELADLDKDGRDELIVIDEVNDVAQAVTVWRWNDWYFQQVWRSQPGQYRDLQTTGLAGSESIILVGKDW